MICRKYRFYKFVLRFFALLLACVLLCGCSQENNGETGQKESQTASANKNKTPKKKRVAITYDDGPHNVRTKQIVDELAKYGFNATFFVVGDRVASVNDKNLTYNGASALKYAASKGNEIGIHGYTHKANYSTCSDAVYESELKNTNLAINKILPDYKVKLMRPIGGSITSERIKECDYAVITWNVDSEDWKYRNSSDEEAAHENVDTIVKNVMSKVSDGSIILMHDLYENTYEATKIILKQLDEQGYEVVTVSELLGNRLSAGKKFNSYKKET